jgi:hypothetical protein
MEHRSRPGDASQSRTNEHLDPKIQAQGEEKLSSFMKGLFKSRKKNENRIEATNENRIEATINRFKEEQSVKEGKQHLDTLEAEVGSYVTARFEIQLRVQLGKTPEQISDEFGGEKVGTILGFESQMKHNPELRLQVEGKLKERTAQLQNSYQSAYKHWDGIGTPPQAPAGFPDQVDIPLRPPVYSKDLSSQDHN